MWVSLIAGVLVAAYLLLLDVVFRAQLTGNGAESLPGISLWVRLIYYVLRSLNEGIVYQLFFGSVFVFLIGRVWRHDGAITPGAYWLGLILAHALNLAINVPFHASTFVYDTLRFFAPGILWAYLYRRHGLSVAIAAHAATHVFSTVHCADLDLGGGAPSALFTLPLTPRCTPAAIDAPGRDESVHARASPFRNPALQPAPRRF